MGLTVAAAGSEPVVVSGLEGVAEFERERASGASGGPEIHAHHTVNTVLRAAERPADDGAPRAFAWSRSVLVTDAAAALGGDLLDELVRTGEGWRIRRRRVTDRDRGDLRAPGEPYDPSDGESFSTWLALR